MPTKIINADRPTVKTPKEREIGDSDVMVNGYLYGQEYNALLKGPRRIKEYDKMRKGDAHVKASLKVVKLPLLSANWNVQAASESRADRQIAEFVEDVLFEGMTRSWQETLTNILLYLDYGVMPFEIVYKFRDDGKIGIKKLAMRHPRTVSRWQMKNGENGIEQTTTKGIFEIPMDKLVIFVNEKEGDDWEGTSILRSAWKHWLFKDRAENIEIIAMEKQGLGVPRGKTPQGATPEDEQKMDTILQNMRANEKGFIRHPADWDVDMLDMKAGTIKNPNDFIKRQEWAIMLNVLATFMQMGSGAVGSFALFKGSNTFFLMALEYVAKHISEAINKYVIEKIVDYNFLDVTEYPKLTYDKIGAVDIQALTTALQRGIQTGVLTVDSNLEDYLRDAMDLPEFTGETLVDPAMADDILAELDGEVAALDGESAPDEQPEEDPDNPGFDMNGEPMPEMPQASEEEVEAVIKAWDDKTKKAAFVTMFSSEVWELMKTITAGGTKGEGTRKPLSEETKKKISEALKRSKGTGGSKSKGKGKKKTDPAITAKKAEIKKIKEEARQFNTQVRRELLEARAKGLKLSPEDQAKKQLDIFNRKEALSSKIAKLQSEIDDIKSKAAAKAEPAAPAKKKAHEHTVVPTPEKLLDLYEAVDKELQTFTADHEE